MQKNALTWYFGPPTQFSPYIGFLIQGLLNFESAKNINERRSQRSAFFVSAARARAPTFESAARSAALFERRSAIVCIFEVKISYQNISANFHVF